MKDKKPQRSAHEVQKRHPEAVHEELQTKKLLPAPTVVANRFAKPRIPFGNPVSSAKNNPTFIQPPAPTTTSFNLPMATLLPDEAEAAQTAGTLVFHCVGDTGGVYGDDVEAAIGEAMEAQINASKSANEPVPGFYYNLGDVVYFNGLSTLYGAQFYEPYQYYPAAIVAIPGNHDGVVYATAPTPTLDAFLRNFCAAGPGHSADAGGLLRTTMIQPGVYFTLEAPFVRILGLYSNVLEDPGVISGENGGNAVLDDSQVNFLRTALARTKTDKFAGAIVIAVHHPPFTGGAAHGGSPLMLQDIDAACQSAGVWPHAVFSGHAHNYQRYTRTVNKYQIPFLVAGCGGHSPLSQMRSTYRTPYKIDDTLTLESYDDTDYGYLRVIVNAKTMRIEFHPQGDGGVTKTPDDHVTIDLATRTVS